MASKKSLASIVMLGDVMLGRLVDEALSVLPDRGAVWGDTLPLLHSGGMTSTGDACAQLVTGNLECAITDHVAAAPKTFNFKLSTQNVDVLTAADFKFVSLANNHVLDYYADGMIETLLTLSKNNIACAGAGPDSSHAAAPAVVEQGGIKVAFLSYSDHYTEWAATKSKGGINFIDPGKYDRTAVYRQVEHAASLADMVIVFIHWGPNWGWKPSKDIQKLGHDFIDAGASCVFGHSAHHIQGIEIRNGKPIIYGAGGFIDDYALDEDYRNDLGFLYCLHLSAAAEKEGEEPGAAGPDLAGSFYTERKAASFRLKELELVPTKIVHEWRKKVNARPPYFSYVQRAVGEDRGWLWRTVQRLSAELKTPVLDGTRGFRVPLGG